MNLLRHALISLAVLVLTWATAGDAHAYPRFQFSSDTDTCNTCHYAPAGGGLINAWGREEAGDTLSRGGDGAVLHGLLDMPEWLAIGGDLRAAALMKGIETSEGTVNESGKLHIFPMQADLSARAEHREFSLTAVVGLRGKARKSAPPDGSMRSESGALSRLVSREHFVTYAPEDSKYTMRGGRFYAPYGLRLADHTSYIRRRAGFGILEETYGLGVSRRGDASETHVTAHVSDPILGSSNLTYGATAMHETRGDAHALGVGARLRYTESNMHGWLGGHYKHWFEGQKLMIMAELNAGYQRFAEAPDNSRLQLLGYVGPVWFPTDGVSASLAYEHYDEDLLTKYVERHAITSTISFLPRAHYELFLMGRAERIGPPGRSFTGMLQLHYYL
tara:strand:- start:161789 stop:162958 length:1170 start_codon:yes stop_codon:yes gene_type:complete